MGVAHLISRRPRCRTCEQCGRLQLLGIDEGIPYRVEPLPLTIQAEIRAIIGGRITYGAHVGYVCMRNEGRMTLDVKWGRPPVFATHKCHLPATAEDIDPSGVEATTAFIAKVIAEQEHRDDPVETATEVEALFSIADLLSGRVVASDGPPPF